MAHYAFINEQNIVTEVIVGIDETDTSTLPEGFASWEDWYENFRGQTCKRTSYNTYGNEHKSEGTAFRGNYAGKGFIYDTDNDVFYEPEPVVEGKTFTLNESTWLWEEMVE
jgi:hypothetical protein